MIQKKVNLFRIIPLIIFFSLILLAFIALKSYDKDNIPSVLIGQSPPPLLLEELGNLKLLDKRDLKPIKENKIRLINFGLVGVHRVELNTLNLKNCQRIKTYNFLE